MKRFILGFSFLGTTPVFAHSGHGAILDFAPGLLHPLIGLDHLVVALAVGLFAVQLGGRALIGVPAAFVGAMMFGIGFGTYGFNVPYVETIIAASIIAVGLALFLRAQISTVIAVGASAVFGLFHGHAHGTEMPHVASALVYMCGLMIATGVLHGIGIVSAPVLKNRGHLVLKSIGALLALYGFGVFAGLA